MSNETVTVATYTSRPEAEAIRERLESLGISCEVQADNVGGMHPHLDVTAGIRLVVNLEDEARARETLADLQAPDPSPPWICPSCGEEVDGNFTVCWNCKRERG